MLGRCTASSSNHLANYFHANKYHGMLLYYMLIQYLLFIKCRCCLFSNALNNQIAFKEGLDASFVLLKMANPVFIIHFLTYQISKDIMNF